MLLAAFILLGIGSFVSITSYNIFFPNAVFELLLFTVIIVSFPHYQFSFTSVLIFFTSLFYFLWQFLNFKLNGTAGTLSDFLMIHKVFIYMSFLVCVGRMRVINNETILLIYKVLSIGMFVKYSISHVFGIDDRPGFFTENNFEIMLLLFLFLAVIRIKKELTISSIIFPVVIILLSGSRSGILGMAAMFLFLDLSKYGVTRFRKFLASVFILALSAGLFILRLDNMSVEDIDRFKFFLVFIDEVQPWGMYEWLVGNPSITPLSYDSASFFNYYYLLFSDYDNNLGFSVLFHSFVLRMLFDHGILGLLFVFISTWWILNKANLSRSEVFAVISVLVLNSTSVSSLNSIYAIWGIIFLLNAGMNTEKVNTNIRLKTKFNKSDINYDSISLKN